MVIQTIHLWNGEIFCCTGRRNPERSYRTFYLHRIIVVHALVAGIPQRNLKYLLHGDCGVHNFVFAENGTLTGIIDPDPVVGEPLYDLIYAFCSSPDMLTVDTILPAVEKLEPEMTGSYELNTEVLQGLYFRIATCIRHHPGDLEKYVEAWAYWLSRIS